MITPGYKDIEAYRWTPFSYVIDFDLVNLTGATCQFQLRYAKDESISPLVNLAVVTSGDGIYLSGNVLTIKIGETVLNALPFNNDRNLPANLYYDLVITTGSIPKSRWLEGKFIVNPGVTH